MKANRVLWLCCEFYTLQGVYLARRWFTTRQSAMDWVRATYPSEYKQGLELHYWVFNSQVGYISTSQ